MINIPIILHIDLSYPIQNYSKGASGSFRPAHCNSAIFTEDSNFVELFLETSMEVVILIHAGRKITRLGISATLEHVRYTAAAYPGPSIQGMNLFF